MVQTRERPSHSRRKPCSDDQSKRHESSDAVEFTSKGPLEMIIKVKRRNSAMRLAHSAQFWTARHHVAIPFLYPTYVWDETNSSVPRIENITLQIRLTQLEWYDTKGHQ